MSEIETVTPETPAEQPANTNTGKNGKPKKSAKREALEWVLTIVAALAIAFVIRTFLFEPVRVDGGSMLETLQDGEIMFVTKFDYLGSNPDRFDVVICHYPNRGTTNFVKRVVGLPGDTVEIKGGYLYVNGEKYEESYIEHRPLSDFAAYTVPEGYYFVMGDNRANSHDSRAADVGPISCDQILGHVRSVLYPFNAWRNIE